MGRVPLCLLIYFSVLISIGDFVDLAIMVMPSFLMFKKSVIFSMKTLYDKCNVTQIKELRTKRPGWLTSDGLYQRKRGSARCKDLARFVICILKACKNVHFYLRCQRVQVST